ncbi:class III extradiol dioxygenase subunit B-like domain-containing protein [Streptomyces sp. B1866]|uniref:class III extradiol dioxygenase subunit B-like domain-containing protein n=1 Tax=Streptomyces sp. B1866 TaxID=3075431 RepID=UPI0028910A3C|nr:class III extradiol dioxygenase subunit B-like domain-containing protein [Streptomyces sp. B1866]MDT3397065.1 class III extradiol dioxygenase subunit B-like domain-containing protein [Streptomyces sp. B1866]
MLIAAAVCPCPPLLVPEVAGGAAHELDALRARCARAVGALAAARPDRLVVVGPAEESGRGPFPQGATGSLRGFGVDVRVTLGAPAADGPAGSAVPDRPLPPSLAVGAWLLERAAWAAAPVSGLGVGEPVAAGPCLTAGRDLTAGDERVALLVMGDGSACRSLAAPGYLDERAAAFDAAAARALGAADTAALAALDEELAREVKAAGRAPWHVLAGAGEGARLTGELLYDEAPYGVGYIVALWTAPA